MKELSRRLESEGWAIADLTLRQFQIRTRDDWRGDLFEYLLDRLEEATDGRLVELAEHLSFEFADRPAAIEPDFWKAGHLRLFITHLATYKAEAGALRDELEASYGISAFVAHTDISPTKEWLDEIELALHTADALTALLKEGFHASEWTDQEIGEAMGRGLVVIPVSFEEMPYGFMGRFQALRGTGTAATLASAIFDILLEHKQTSQRMAESLVTTFEESYSFSDARKNMALLERTRYFDAQLAARVTAALTSNDQLGDAFTVPERVKRLIAKWGV